MDLDATIPTPAVGGGFGHSSDPDAATAAREAVAAALAGRVPTERDLLLVFCSATYAVDALCAAATDAAGPAQVVGATTCGAFTADAFVADGCVAAFVDGSALSIGVAHVDHTDDADLAATGRRVAELAAERGGEERPFSVLLLLADGLAADQRELARGTYEVTSALVPLVGGAAGDDLRWEAIRTFGEGRVSDRGVVGVWINGDRPMTVCNDRSWRPLGRPMLVTRADGGVVHELDGRPALEVYLEVSGVAYDGVERINIAGMERPVGLPNSLGSYDVRQLHDRTDDGALVFTSAIPEQTALHVMATDGASMLDGAEAVGREALEDLGHDASLGLVFSCATRGMMLGERIVEEARAVSRGLGGVPVGGFLTVGEFARATGSLGNHHSTVALLAL